MEPDFTYEIAASKNFDTEVDIAEQNARIIYTGISGSKDGKKLTFADFMRLYLEAAGTDSSQVDSIQDDNDKLLELFLANKDSNIGDSDNKISGSDWTYKEISKMAEILKNGLKNVNNMQDVADFNSNNMAARSSSSTNSSVATPSVTGNAIIDTAKKYVGNPYVWGGNSLTNGCDCSHFVSLVLDELGIEHGGYASTSKMLSSYVGSGNFENVGTDASQAQAGDILVFSGHTAFYDGNR